MHISSPCLIHDIRRESQHIQLKDSNRDIEVSKDAYGVHNPARHKSADPGEQGRVYTAKIDHDYVHGHEDEGASFRTMNSEG